MKKCEPEKKLKKVSILGQFRNQMPSNLLAGIRNHQSSIVTDD